MAVQFKVFKKTSQDGNISIYLGRRDYVDHVGSVDSVDGVLLVEPEALKGNKVYGQLVCSFRYGDENEQCANQKTEKSLHLHSEQIYPPTTKVTPTKLQERAMKKLGGNSYPFSFKMPVSAPPSMAITPRDGDEGKPCNVTYYVKAFIGKGEEDNSNKESLIQMTIRRIQYSPTKRERKPCTMVKKDFMLQPGEEDMRGKGKEDTPAVELEISLDKEMYYHGEKISVQISVRNQTNTTVSNIKATAVQCTDVTQFGDRTYRAIVDQKNSTKGCPVQPGTHLEKNLHLVPAVEMSKTRKGVALDGLIENVNAKLASSTLLVNPDDKDKFGMIVTYHVKVKVYMGKLGGELSAELPFVLMNPEPNLKAFMRADSQAKYEVEEE